MSKLISYCARQKSINCQAAVQTRRGFATPSKSLKRTKYSRFVTVPLLLAGTSDVLLAQWMHANPEHMQWLQKEADTNQLAGFVVDNINLVNGGIDQLKGALSGLQESITGSSSSGSSASPVALSKHSEVASPKTILSRLPIPPLSAPNSEVLKKAAAAKKEQEEIDQKELDLQKKKLAEKQLVLQKEAEERARLDKETQQKEVVKTKERHKEGFMKELTSMVHMLKSTSEQAIAAHQEAVDAIRDHSSQLKQALDSTGETDGVEGVWTGVIAASEAAAVAVEAAEKLQLITLESVETVQRKVLEGKSDTEVKKLEDLKSADSLAKTLKQDLSQAVTRFEKAQTDFSMVREYRNMIKEAREQFKKELESLNPELKMGQKFGGKLSDEELGMLVGHAHTRIQQLQNQLAEAKALDKLRIERAMLEQKSEDRKVTDALVQREHNSMLSELEQEKQKWIQESHKMFEEMLAKELARQENGHIEHIQSSLKVRAQHAQLPCF